MFVYRSQMVAVVALVVVVVVVVNLEYVLQMKKKDCKTEVYNLSTRMPCPVQGITKRRVGFLVVCFFFNIFFFDWNFIGTHHDDGSRDKHEQRK